MGTSVRLAAGRARPCAVLLRRCTVGGCCISIEFLQECTWKSWSRRSKVRTIKGLLWQTGRRVLRKNLLHFLTPTKETFSSRSPGMPPPLTGFFLIGVHRPCQPATKKASLTLAFPLPSPHRGVPPDSSSFRFRAGHLTQLTPPLAPFVTHPDIEGVGFAVENLSFFMQCPVFDHASFSSESRMADFLVFLACHGVPLSVGGRRRQFCCPARAGKTKSPGSPGLSKIIERPVYYGPLSSNPSARNLLGGVLPAPHRPGSTVHLSVPASFRGFIRPRRMG